MTTDNERYLAADIIRRLAQKKRRQQRWGWILTVFFTLSVVLSLSSRADQTLRDGLPFYLACLAASAFLLWRGYVNAALLSRARRYGAIFAQDRDGTVTADELKQLTGLSSGKILSQLEPMFKRGLFQDCTLRQGDGKPCVILADALTDARSGFVNVRCASCGGTSRIRAGTVGVCEYCGSPVRAE